MERKSPKEQLAGHELIGFDRRDDAPGQTVRRASSAKVTIKPGFKPAVSASTADNVAKSRAPGSTS
ncbi:hypothetical protein [Bauldia litoralis]|uniref:Uncharacterized protein n=1 Tax=Bauldia litoralis TaxID=665467 RepID=A0A1G6EPN2_9HYPH|nr:hypothetical protein [Bauldia litoralis]SDB59286.1 hypothetical protein SAMN02982931_04783 [Bauldia litoralis]